MSKHKRKAKRLLTCPQCGQRNLTSLKAHRCKKGSARASRAGEGASPSQALEIVNPPESLKAIEAKLSPVVDLIERKTVDLLYDVVEAGLYLMKAQDAHVCATVAHSADGRLAGHGEDTGFQGWLEQKYPRISRRSAYNYINAAKSCGLTSQDDASAIEKLRKANALQGKTATDLYRLKDQEQDQDQDQDAPRGKRWELIRDAAVNFREHSETVVELKPQMNKKVFSTVCARALRTLEELTGSTWDMVERRHGEPFKEHGDVYDLGS